MTYRGGKGGAGVAQTIINQQPPHDEYIEAFLGGGAVMRVKRPASRNVGIDVDASTIAAFRDAGSCTELFNTDAIAYLQHRRCWTGRELVYCDPPYIRSTRRRHRAIYRYELTDPDHSRLLAVLQVLPCMVQISGYWSEMYAEALKDWRLVSFIAQTRRGPALECLWMNYPTPTVLHDFRFLGSDFRERERIRRKATRWVNGLRRLPSLERLALYSAMSADLAANDERRRTLPVEMQVSL